MSSPLQGLTPGTSPSWSLNFWNHFHRYRVLAAKYWWVMALTVSVAICAAAWYLVNTPPPYLSVAKLSMGEGQAIKVGGAAEQSGSAFNQQMDDLINTEKEIIKSAAVSRLATDRLAAQYPDMPESKVKLEMVQRSSILILNATGPNREYTQRWLAALVEGYQQKKRDMRREATSQALEKVREEIARLDGLLKEDDDRMIKFQRDAGMVMEKGKNARQNDVVALEAKLSSLTSDLDQLSLMTPDQALNGGGSRRSSVTSSDPSNPQAQNALESPGAEDAYRQAQQLAVKYKADLDDLSRDLRPKHPKIIALKAEIERQERLTADLLSQNAKRIANRREFVGSLLKATRDQLEEAKKRALSADLLQVEFDKLADKKGRDEKTYNDLQKAMIDGSMNVNVDSGSVNVMEAASVAELVPSVWIKVLALALALGLGTGVGLLLLIDRMDDRMGSINDFKLNFSEHVVGQIPRDSTDESTELLVPDDQRHQLVESFRNLRSTLLYMPMEGARPKTILITSAIPNEGKSTVSSNLALVLAFAGMKTLLIDSDLRRGAIHKAFGLSRGPGLTDVLGHNVNWKLAIRDTGVDNLHVLPRGRNVPQPAEYLLNKNTDALLKELYPLYDYIIIDSSPILAADDTASLAPKIDATLFVVRLSFTSAKMTRKSLEILYGRGANIPGLILNQVDTSSPEFVYYQYSEYYHTMQGDDEDGENGTKTPPRKPHTPSAPSTPLNVG